MDINNALKLYINYLQFERESSAHTVNAYRKDIIDFISYMNLQTGGDEFQFKEITKNVVREYLMYLSLEKQLKGTSIRRKVYALNSFFNYLENEEILKQNPFYQIKMPKKEKTLPVFLSGKELDKLIDTSEKFLNKNYGLRDVICLSILRYTGCRRNELLNLRWENLNIEEGSIKFLGKGNKERLVPIHPRLKFQLSNYKSQLNYPTDGFVIVGREQKKLSNSGLKKIMDKYLKLAGLDERKITPHKIRHSFASELIQNGVDIRIIQQWLGHESISTTAIYTHVNFDQLSKVWGDSEYE